jgi:GxxExxY protein
MADFVLPAWLVEDIARCDDLCRQIIACAIAVHDALGPGLLESIYRDCLVMELRLAGLKVECEVRVPIYYRGKLIRDHLRLDLLVEGIIVVEVKSADRIHAVHLSQVITYLKLADKPAGLLLNFNSSTLKAGLRRLNHPAVHARRNHAEGLPSHHVEGQPPHHAAGQQTRG